MAAQMLAREAPARWWVDVAPEIRRWSRDEYQRAGELGIFGPAERLELIAGEVVRKVTPQRSMHAAAVQRVNEAFQRYVGPARSVRVQLPLGLGDDSEPEPDIAVVKRVPDGHASAHPTTALLIVEVSDTTLRFDRMTKASLYAREGIADYRILNLPDRVLECHRAPAPMADQPFGYHYRSITRHTEDEQVTPLFGGPPVLVRDLLPLV
ncbi:MAG: Uma2 family endonuclease [Luteitalea sp.]|nr:Uma2 family endonuclease [Luteitalea sp.]